MHSSSLLLFAVVLIIALNTLSISGKAVKSTATNATTTTTTTLAPTTKLVVAVKIPGKAVAAKPAAASKDGKKKKAPAKKSKKPKQSPWKDLNADQKKLFNDYKTILRTKLAAKQLNLTATHQLEPTKYGSQVDGNSILHHYLVKLPDAKYAHAIIGTNKDPKKVSPINENNASFRRTIYDNLAAAEA